MGVELEVSGELVRGSTSEGETGQVRWEELGIVSVLRADDGPRVLLAAHDVGTVIHVPLPEADEVMARVRRLPGFDEERFEDAVAGRGERHSIVWSNGWAAARQGGRTSG